MTLENAEGGIVERINPLTVPVGILSVHKVRYEFAAPYCAGRSTLDIACGAGYGTAHLAGVASMAVGGDADQGAIDFAIQHYSGDNLRFELLDALAMPFENNSFERVVSFETIEHLPKIDIFLKEVARVLSPDGLFVVSTPLVPTTNHRPANPHHHVEFSIGDFQELLGGYFTSVDMFGQSRVQSAAHRVLQKLDVFGIRHRVPSIVRTRTTRALATVPYEDMGTQNQQIRRDDFTRAHDMLAVCAGPRNTF